MKDSYRHKGLRAKLVKQLKDKGIKDIKVLAAIGAIPRHYFLDNAFDEWAYKDQAFPIGSGQTISQPYTVARQSELLEIFDKCKVLEIGTGSGYQAAVLATMNAKVYSIERQKLLFDKTSSFLPKIGFNSIRTLYGDGYEGSPRFAPFDRIIATAGINEIPKKLFQQLKVGGIMLLPIGDQRGQVMTRILKTSETSYDKETFGKFSFVPFLKGTSGMENHKRKTEEKILR